MIKIRFPTSARIPAGIALVATAALGLGVGTLVGDDTPSLRLARAERDQAVERLGRVAAERERLRDERDRLEERLAAGTAPAVCPAEFVGTRRLLPFFEVDFPCGWHALFGAQQSRATEERPGLHVELTLFSRVPLSLAPRAGALADIELAQWTDDPSDDADRLQPIATWVQDERKRFAEVTKDERFQGGSGVTVYRLDGKVSSEEETIDASVALWEFVDTVDGARHVVRVFAASPNARAIEALDRMARSFRLLEA